MFSWSSFVFMVFVIKIVHRNLFLAQTWSDISSLSSIFQLYEMGRQKSRRKHGRSFNFYCSDLAPPGSPGHFTTGIMRSVIRGHPVAGQRLL